MIVKLNLNLGTGIEGNHILLIERNSKIESNLKDLFNYFEDDITISRIRRFHKYYRVKAPNLAIIISLVSTILELIPEAVIMEESNIL